MKLSDLAGPDAAGWADVAVFVRADGSESEPFVVGVHAEGRLSRVRFATHGGRFFGSHPVRSLGRGRLEPARIVMEGEADLAAQARVLREACDIAKVSILGGPCRDDPAMRDVGRMLERVLAATAPTPCPTCNGIGTIPDPYDVYDVDIPTQCHWCLGTKVYPPEPPEDHR